MKIKICGITTVADALYAEQLGVDFIGLNFSSRSKRKLTIEQAKPIVNVLSKAKTIGIFVDETDEEILTIMNAVQLQGIQLYRPIPALIKNKITFEALRIQDHVDEQRVSTSSADYVLLDSFRTGPVWGASVQFDWQLLPADRHRLFVAGGITIDNIHAIIKTKVCGVDICSGVESAPGIKDKVKMKQLVESIRHG